MSIERKTTEKPSLCSSGEGCKGRAKQPSLHDQHSGGVGAEGEEQHSKSRMREPKRNADRRPEGSPAERGVAESNLTVRFD